MFFSSSSSFLLSSEMRENLNLFPSTFSSSVVIFLFPDLFPSFQRVCVDGMGWDGPSRGLSASSQSLQWAEQIGFPPRKDEVSHLHAFAHSFRRRNSAEFDEQTEGRKEVVQSEKQQRGENKEDRTTELRRRKKEKKSFGCVDSVCGSHHRPKLPFLTSYLRRRQGRYEGLNGRSHCSCLYGSVYAQYLKKIFPTWFLIKTHSWTFCLEQSLSISLVGFGFLNLGQKKISGQREREAKVFGRFSLFALKKRIVGTAAAADRTT